MCAPGLRAQVYRPEPRAMPALCLNDNNGSRIFLYFMLFLSEQLNAQAERIDAGEARRLSDNVQRECSNVHSEIIDKC